MTKTTIAVGLAWGLAIAVTARAQTPGDAPVAAAPAPALAVRPEAPPPAPATIPIGTRVGMLPSTYEDGNRRDPFTSLVAQKATAAAPRPSSGGPVSGISDLVLADVTVRGIVRSGPTMLAILEGPNRQSFVARPDQKLRDATVQSIDAGGVVFVEQAAGTRPMTVRKTLRPSGEDIQ
jgi:hypothetical protein